MHEWHYVGSLVADYLRHFFVLLRFTVIMFAFFCVKRRQPSSFSVASPLVSHSPVCEWEWSNEGMFNVRLKIVGLWIFIQCICIGYLGSVQCKMNFVNMVVLAELWIFIKFDIFSVSVHMFWYMLWYSPNAAIHSNNSKVCRLWQ